MQFNQEEFIAVHDAFRVDLALPVAPLAPNAWVDSVAASIDGYGAPECVTVGLTRPGTRSGGSALHAWTAQFAEQSPPLDEYPRETIAGREMWIGRGLGAVVWRQDNWVLAVKASPMAKARGWADKVRDGTWRLGTTPTVAADDIPAPVTFLNWSRDARSGWSGGVGFGPGGNSFLGWFVRGSHIPDQRNFRHPDDLVFTAEDETGSYSIGPGGAQRVSGDYTAIMLGPLSREGDCVRLLRAIQLPEDGFDPFAFPEPE